ncbi:phospholipase D-like domain-containing protein [Vibrio parahaemolyticus]|uniref:hypothetical protein n=1 Tax=Vibrio parahaemolyticus TaxID=670 RepID=UPI0007B6A41C|nr:hypothetical protein [Vibrio parahaemolyticus]ANC00170.1 hypothetical protein FORC14_4473 [Vibrio parahaemolyticus]
MSSIKVKTVQFNKDYRSEVLPAVFLKQGTDCDFNYVLPIMDSDAIVAEVEKTKLTLLIAVNELRDSNIIRALVEKADNGARVYLLLGRGDNQAAIEALSGRCLVRQVAVQNGGLLLRDHSTNKAKGWIFTNHRPFCSEQVSAWSLELERLQIEDCFRSFCKLFWQEGNTEFVKQGEAQKGQGHPDGDVITNHSYQQAGQLSKSIDTTLAHLQSRSTFKAGTVSYDAAEVSHRALLPVGFKETVSHNKKALTESKIPNLLISERDAWLLTDESDTTQTNWCLKLSKQQQVRFQDAYEKAFNNAAWQYQPATAMEQFAIGQKIRFADQVHQEFEIAELNQHKLEPVTTSSVDSFLSDTPEQLTENQTAWQPQFLAHSYQFEVQIHPPYCPDNATADPLYQKWRETQQDWDKRLATLEKLQESIDQQQVSLGQKFNHFVTLFLLGEKQSVQKLNTELETLKVWDPTFASPSERESYRERLSLLTEAISKRGKDTDIKLDEAKQESEWQARKRKLEKDDAEAKERKEKARTEWKKQEEQKQEQESKVESAFAERWAQAVYALGDEALEKLKLESVSFEQFLPEEKLEDKEQQKEREVLAQEAYLTEKRKRLADMDYCTANNWRNNSLKLKDKIFGKHYPSLAKVFTDCDAGMDKISRTIKEAEDAFKKAEKACQQSETALKDHGEAFKFKSRGSSNHLDKQLGIPTNKKDQTAFTWPEEDLPANDSQLRSIRKQRWLVISDEKQLPQARKDSSRLNAKICVDPCPLPEA